MRDRKVCKFVDNLTTTENRFVNFIWFLHHILWWLLWDRPQLVANFNLARLCIRIILIGSSFGVSSLSSVLKLLMGVRKKIWGSLAESFQKICCQCQRMMRMNLVLVLRRMKVKGMKIVTVWVTWSGYAQFRSRSSATCEAVLGRLCAVCRVPCWWPRVSKCRQESRPRSGLRGRARRQTSDPGCPGA